MSKDNNRAPQKPRPQHPWRRNPWDGTLRQDKDKKFSDSIKGKAHEKA